MAVCTFFTWNLIFITSFEQEKNTDRCEVNVTRRVYLRWESSSAHSIVYSKNLTSPLPPQGTWLYIAKQQSFSPPFALDLDGKILILLALNFNDNVSDLEDSPLLLWMLSIICHTLLDFCVQNLSFLILLILIGIFMPEPADWLEYI